MKSLKELMELRGQKLEALKAIVDAATADKRELTEEEKQSRDTINTDIDNLDVEIEAAKKTEKRMTEMAGSFNKENTEKKEEKEVRSYSFLKAIRSKAEGKPLEGLEKEMDEEAKREANESGLSLTGIGIPSIVLNAQKRDLTATGGDHGDYTIKTDIKGFIENLRAKMLVTSLGAQTLTGLKGNIDIPAGDTASSVAWEGENDANAETNPTIKKKTLSPKRLGAYSDISKQLIMQSSYDAEVFVRNDIEQAIRLAVDLAAINGSGTNDQPLGILNTVGIGAVPGGENGLAPTWSHIVNLEKEVAVDNADIGKLAYLTNPKVRAKLKQTLLDSGSGLFLWPQDGKLNGYKTGVSTQVPSNLTKGTSENVCSAIIFGNFNDLIIGQWGGLDIIVDPYTQATNATVRLVVNSWWDIVIRHAESFAAMADALTE